MVLYVVEAIGKVLIATKGIYTWESVSSLYIINKG